MSEALLNRTKKFCLDVIFLAKKLPKTFLGNYIRAQITRSGCSVASNHRAARLAQSKAGFVAKISIVIEEADECSFWCEIIEYEKLLNDPLLDKVYKEADELTSIFVATRKTIEKNNK
ncbi:MAG: four helix bundle protein [Bacteroidota bacterium]